MRKPAKKSNPPQKAGHHRLSLATSRLPRHAPFYISGVAGALTLALTLWLMPGFAIVISAIVMFAVYLILLGLLMPVLTAEFLRSRGDEADAPALLIFLAVLGVVAVCCGALFMALNGEGGPLLQEVLLSVGAVLLGWFVIHTMAAMHYAYEYYESESANPKASGAAKAFGVVGGLEFPEGDNPDGVAFLYFAYVIGTAFAVSDIRVTSNAMRKLILLHSTFSYFFNTLIVAATVNVAVAVGGA